MGALDAAIYTGIEHGGWCPRGRKQEKDKTIPAKYNLTEMKSADYLKRTEANVADSDATLILTFGPLGGGSKRTMDFAKKHNKPCLHIAIDEYSRRDVTNFVQRWFEGDICKPTPPHSCILNVAGNRESGAPGVRRAVMIRMVDILTAMNGLSFYPLHDDYDPEEDDGIPASEADLSPLAEWAEQNMPPPPELYHPKTVEEAVDIVLNALSYEKKDLIREQDKDEFMTSAHFGLGMGIRNTMLHQNENLIDLMADFQQGCREGKWDGQAEPDDVSRVIVELVWETLKEDENGR